METSVAKRTRSHLHSLSAPLESPKRSRCHICMTVARETTKVLEMTSTTVDSDRDTCHLVCGHLYHTNCVVNYFNTTPSPTCPLCRDRTYIDWKPETKVKRYYNLLDWTLPEETVETVEPDEEEDPEENERGLDIVRYVYRHFYQLIHD